MCLFIYLFCFCRKLNLTKHVKTFVLQEAESHKPKNVNPYNGQITLNANKRFLNMADEDLKTINKKDLEYMAYQADPSLTVENLSSQPQISFRKESFPHYVDNSLNSIKVSQ